MLVHKFGGTSVGSAERFSSAADILLNNQYVQEADNKPALYAPGDQVVVVSAMSSVTDNLIAGARAAAEGSDQGYREIKAEVLRRHLEVVETVLLKRSERLEIAGLIEDNLHELERHYRSIAVLGEVTMRGYDAVTSFGEYLSASILAAVLRERGQRAQAVSATELIVTDDQFGNAKPLLSATRAKLRQRLVPLLESGTFPVITGYIAATENGVTTTLGRGGSDYSAAILAAGLDASEVWIWSDVNGILTADPNLVPQAHTLSELSYDEAANLAYYGADVLHPKTIHPVVASKIPLRLRNSFNPEHPGTLIVKNPSPGRTLLPAIISTTELTMIAVGSQDDSWTPDAAARALRKLCAAGLDVPMFSQSFSEHSLNLVVREQDHNHCLKLLCEEFGNTIAPNCVEGDDQRAQTHPEGNGFILGTREKVATVSVVGVPDWNKTGIAAHAFASLGNHGARVIAVAQAASEYNVSFCIPEDQVNEIVPALHMDLGLDKLEIEGRSQISD